MVGDEGGESGSGIRLAYSTSIILLVFSMTRCPAAAHIGPTPGCCDKDLLTSAALSAKEHQEQASTDLLASRPSS